MSPVLFFFVEILNYMGAGWKLESVFFSSWIYVACPFFFFEISILWELVVNWNPFFLFCLLK